MTFIAACHVTSRHVTSRHVTSHHITSHHITSHHITSRHVTSRHTTSSHTIEFSANTRTHHSICVTTHSCVSCAIGAASAGICVVRVISTTRTASSAIVRTVSLESAAEREAEREEKVEVMMGRSRSSRRGDGLWPKWWRWVRRGRK